MIKNILKTLFTLCVASLLFSSCGEDALGPSIIKDVVVDTNSVTYKFDTWLNENFRKPYNLDFKYAMVDLESNLGFNLIPADFDKAQEMAKLAKYLWFEPYEATVGVEFLRQNSPRIIHLIGSDGINPITKTTVAGTAEGGIKVTLYGINKLEKPYLIDELNHFYFNVMHHEFMHILHQKRNYPQDFIEITKGLYNPFTWSKLQDVDAYQMGFVSPYATSSYDEDFVETIAVYLTSNDQKWNEILYLAQGGASKNKNGHTHILAKLKKCRSWLKTEWNVDLEVLRAEIRTREGNINNI